MTKQEYDRKMKYYELQKRKYAKDIAKIEWEAKELEYTTLKDELEAAELVEPLGDKGHTELHEFVQSLPISHDSEGLHLMDQFDKDVTVDVKSLESTVVQTLCSIKNEPPTLLTPMQVGEFNMIKEKENGN
jgi:hypothetical protein